MKFSSTLLEGRLLRRYKRFLADVETAGGVITAHCPNTGSMLGCTAPGSRVWLSKAATAGRKYAHTWEIVEVNGSTLVGINTGLSNRLVREAVENGTIGPLQGYRVIRGEVRYGEEGSRIDFLLESDRGRRCYLEVKNVTAAVQDGIALFPDAVSERGTKHLREMMHTVRAGHRAVLCFCVQRGDVTEVRPADAIDPVYGKTLREALARGVEAMAWRATVSPQGITLRDPLPVTCP